MFTIKIHSKGEGQRIATSDRDVTILGSSDHEFRALCLSLEKQHDERMKNQAPQEEFSPPHAIVSFSNAECLSTIYLYEGDRAWIMNANGKTVATV